MTVAAVVLPLLMLYYLSEEKGMPSSKSNFPLQVSLVSSSCHQFPLLQVQNICFSWCSLLAGVGVWGVWVCAQQLHCAEDKMTTGIDAHRTVPTAPKPGTTHRVCATEVTV